MMRKGFFKTEADNQPTGRPIDLFLPFMAVVAVCAIILGFVQLVGLLSSLEVDWPTFYTPGRMS